MDLLKLGSLGAVQGGHVDQVSDDASVRGLREDSLRCLLEELILSRLFLQAGGFPAAAPDFLHGLVVVLHAGVFLLECVLVYVLLVRHLGRGGVMSHAWSLLRYDALVKRRARRRRIESLEAWWDPRALGLVQFAGDPFPGGRGVLLAAQSLPVGSVQGVHLLGWRAISGLSLLLRRRPRSQSGVPRWRADSRRLEKGLEISLIGELRLRGRTDLASLRLDGHRCHRRLLRWSCFGSR